MTVGLQLTDGTSTIDLNDGSYISVMELDMGAGDISAENVTGSVRLYIEGTKAQIQAEVLLLSKMLQAAIDYSGQSGGGALYSSLNKPIYIEYRTDNTEAPYRSELYRVSAGIAPESIEVLNFDCGGIIFIIDFERRNWWEGAEVELMLSNHITAATTNPVFVYNPYVSYRSTGISFDQASKEIRDSNNGMSIYMTGDTIRVVGSTSNDGNYTVATGNVAAKAVVVQALVNEAAGDTVDIYGAQCNYVEIASTQVGGDLPARTRIEMTNMFNSVTYTGALVYNLGQVWIGQNFTNPTTMRTLLPSGTLDSYETVSIPSGTETAIATWSLEDALLDAAAGRYFKFQPAFKTASLSDQPIRYRVKFYAPSYAKDFWLTSQVKLEVSSDANIFDLFTIPLPPALAGISSLEGFDLIFTAYHELGTSYSISIDYAHLTPADGFQWVKSIGTEYGGRIVLDGVNEAAYQDDGAGLLKLAFVKTAGAWILLQPGRTQRLYFMQHTDNIDLHYVYQSMSIKVYARPRRLTI